MRRIIQWFNKHFRPKKRRRKKSMGNTLLIKQKDTAANVANTNLVGDTSSDNEGRKKLYQYSKKITNVITFFSLIWITWSYVLCTITVVKWGNSQSTLESLSTAVCQTILSVLCVYFAKSLIETALEKRNERLTKFESEAQETIEQVANSHINTPPPPEINDEEDNNAMG